MSEEKKAGRKLTQARKEANARYNSKFVEVKVRMTPERRSIVQDHAASMEESATAFIYTWIFIATRLSNSIIVISQKNHFFKPCKTCVKALSLHLQSLENKHFLESCQYIAVANKKYLNHIFYWFYRRKLSYKSS